MDRTKASDAFNAGSIPVGCIFLVGFSLIIYEGIMLGDDKKKQNGIGPDNEAMDRPPYDGGNYEGLPYEGSSYEGSPYEGGAVDPDHDDDSDLERVSLDDVGRDPANGLPRRDISREEMDSEVYGEEFQRMLSENANEASREDTADLKSFLGAHRGGIIIGVVAVAVVIIAVIIIQGFRTGKMGSDGNVAVSGNTLQDVSAESGLAVPKDALKEDAYPEVNDLIKRYFEAREKGDLENYQSMCSYMSVNDIAIFQAKAEYIEGYENIKCYTKQGPMEDSYIVYVTFDLKLKDWAQTAPGQLALLVCRGEDGQLFVYSDANMDEQVGEYIRAVSSQQDVVDLYNRVQAEYQETLSKDPAFADYVSSLTEMIHNDAGNRLAASLEQEGGASGNEASSSVSGDSASENAAGLSGNEAISGNAVSGNGVSDNETASENAAVSGNEADDTGSESFEVRATSNVNVRVSDSENADKIGKVTAGTVLKCLAQQENGWSKVEYEDKTGYIKTDYLVRNEGTNEEGGEQNAAHGTVMVTSTVNIRETADTKGKKLGVAYAGESFDLIEKGSEWTKISYQGKTGYVKTDYISD